MVILQLCQQNFLIKQVFYSLSYVIQQPLIGI